MLKFKLISLGLVIFCASGAHAECMQALTVKFVENAPKDRFDVIHTATGMVVKSLRIDLSASARRLVFDTASGRKGVEVFQPFELQGEMQEIEMADGADQLEVRLNDMSFGQRAGFAIDVGDSQTQSDLGQIRVTGGGLEGARAVFNLADGTVLEAQFDTRNRAKVCT